ncbi:MAG TPA: hypothetical protein VFJ82_16150 [Longimicrobium sp.]|nr:hypothetical protein [Longimicrobium sp.]
MASDDVVIASAARLVSAARGLADDYAGAAAPVSPDQLRVLLAASGCHVEIFPFRSDALGMTLPFCAGVHPVLVNGDTAGVDRWFALRHQVAHVLAGDTNGAVCLAGEGFHHHPERVADLFALADAVPGWWITRLVHACRSWNAVRVAVASRVAEIAPAWPPARVHDRAELRLRIFCDEGI